MLIVIQVTLSNHGHKTTVTKTMQQDQKDLYFVVSLAGAKQIRYVFPGKTGNIISAQGR